MNAQYILDISNAINSFNDSEFVSVYGEDKIIVKNPQTESTFAINFSESNGNFIFDTNSAKLIQNGKNTPEEEYQEKVKNFSEAIKGVFTDDYNKSIEKLSNFIINEDFTKPTKDKRKSKPENIFTKLNHKIKNYQEQQEEIEESYKLFDNNGNLKKGVFVEPSYIDKVLEAKKEETNNFEKYLENIKQFDTLLREKYTNDIVKGIFENVNLFNIEKSLTPALVTIKEQYDSHFNPTREMKNVKKMYNKAFQEQPVIQDNEEIKPLYYGESEVYIPSNGPGYSYLKTNEKKNDYTLEQLDYIENVLDKLIGSIHEFDDEDLSFFNEQKTKIMYMTSTGQISDEVVTQVVEEVNKRVAQKQQTKNDYDDPSKQLGWKSRQEVWDKTQVALQDN